MNVEVVDGRWQVAGGPVTLCSGAFSPTLCFPFESVNAWKLASGILL